MSLDEGQEDLKSRLEKQLAEMELQRQSLIEIKSDWAGDQEGADGELSRSEA